MHSFADIAQPTEQIPRRRIVVRHVNKQTKCLHAYQGAFALLVGRPEPSDVHTQAIIMAGSPDRADVERLYATDPFVVHGIFVLERIAPWLVYVDRWASGSSP